MFSFPKEAETTIARLSILQSESEFPGVKTWRCKISPFIDSQTPTHTQSVVHRKSSSILVLVNSNINRKNLIWMFDKILLVLWSHIIVDIRIGGIVRVKVQICVKRKVLI